MANKFVYCVCFALAISHFTLPFDVCQPEAFWFMKRVLLFQSYQEKLKIPYATFHECSRPVPWAWAGEMGWGWRSTSCMMGNVKMVNLSLHWTKVSLLYSFHCHNSSWNLPLFSYKGKAAGCDNYKRFIMEWSRSRKVKINPSFCTPVFFYALPKYLQSELERVQTRALSIIFPSLSYDEALDEAGIPTIISYREDICVNVFNTAHGNRDNKLNNKLLTEASEAPYSLRSHRHFAFPKWETDRFKNTFILSSCLKYN